MDRQRWALLAGTGAVLAVCVVAAVLPGLERLDDATVAAAGVLTSAFIAATTWRHQRGARGWRLMVVATLFPVVAFVAYLVVAPADPLDRVLLRWVPTVPAYLLAGAALLTLVARRRRRTGIRAVVETALFGAACLTGMQLLVFGPQGTWAVTPTAGRLVLTAAVLTTSALLVAALVLLAAVESHRQPMALVLVGSALFLTSGRGLGTSATLHGLDGAVTASRFLVVAGLALLSLAATLDPRPGRADSREPRPRTGRSVPLGTVLPHLAMLVALLGVGITTLCGLRPSSGTVALALACVTLAGAHRWVTALDDARLSTRILRSEAWFRSLVRSNGDAVLILDADLRITWASPTVERLLGAGTVLTGRDLLTVTHPADAVPVARALHPALPGEETGDLLTLRLPHADGRWRHVEASVADLRADAEVGGIVLYCRDATARHAREKALEDLAFTDPTTGLPNRAGCDRLIEQRLAAAAEPGDPGTTLLLIEVDGLAEVREDAGRDLASSVLVELARRLRTTVRGDEPVVRLGGDAFAVLASGDPRTGDLLADRCLSAVEQPIATAAGVYDLTADIGLVPLEAGTPLAEVWSRAEIAVRAARRAGRGTARRFDPVLGSAAERRARLREDLPGACARGELAVAFQPVVSLVEQRIVGVEALLRWRHPELGEVPPAEFVPIAERAGVIGELQRWALDQAARAAVALPVLHAPLRLGVNISASHVAARTLVGDVAAVLQCTGLAPERLILEITEATLMAGTDDIAVDVEALRLMGVHVALDDFGTGHSSLTHLSALPIDVLKLDRDFVARVDRDPRSRALCESVIAIGRALGLDVVAEGVETPAQLGVLRGLGCGFAQGFLLSRPLRLSELTELLETGAGALWPGLVGSR
ncbi:putative bifunctional diguanylate cyclase/phosphodiesterase [Trujillonella endophytica]|uniref:PAS domain S-box-containing protein/diguanylate cyclase (GGDEF) domain-containing protein n=1 Tax=Trujillonella endophytica TaxID=673521 RepID=A0A1H8THB8_9ACTN|nr:EAL domain-containing protein [Trujillella endophytica]SEO90490.1 PAS domain S-box-containing protein/diguanylate cyclase (GGDEF) domain-containing protein [Trujillella endophytica]